LQQGLAQDFFSPLAADSCPLQAAVPAALSLQQDFFSVLVAAAEASPVLALQQDLPAVDLLQDLVAPAHCFFSDVWEVATAVPFFSAAN
jgi:hypothetical protein